MQMSADFRTMVTNYMRFMVDSVKRFSGFDWGAKKQHHVENL
uniref:Uncharacterized protein n=1 Tax=Tetranychus urticae TaxID=32264 RepID=T1K7F3_TETUR